MPETTLPVVNKAAALERLDSDEELYNEVVEVFFEDTPVQLAKLHEAMSANIISEVTRLSHSLKSAAGNIGAERMSSASLKAEKTAKSGILDGLPELIRNIQQEFGELARFLNRA